MKTIAQQLNLTDFPFEIRDKNNNKIYIEYSNGYCIKREYDSKNNIIYYEDSNGYWSKREFDKNNNEIYWEDLNGYWAKKEWDSTGLIYFEDSNGEIIDNRPKTTPEYTMEELIAKVGYEFKIKK